LKEEEEDMYTWYVSGVAMEIHMVKLSRRGPCMVVPSDYAMAMDEYFWGQFQGYDLGE
jgi:hypothetical protein